MIDCNTKFIKSLMESNLDKLEKFDGCFNLSIIFEIVYPKSTKILPFEV